MATFKTIRASSKTLAIRKATAKANKTMAQSGFSLRDYQQNGVSWMIRQELKSEHSGGILADDPGLGKTIQTLGLMAGLPKKTLLIVPVAVAEQWQQILITVFGYKSLYFHYGPEKLRTADAIKSQEFDVCLTTHGTSISSKKNCYTTQLHIPNFWERIIIDEGHVIRNSKTKMFKTNKNYSNIIPSRWILSGTPLQNKRQDIVTLLNFIGIPSEDSRVDLNSYILQYVLRRTKKVLITEGLVHCDFKTHLIPFNTPDEQEIYESLETESLEILADLKYSGAAMHEYEATVLETIIRMRQASSHPNIALRAIRRKYSDDFIDVPMFDGDSTKITRITQDLSKTSGLSLVFCHYRGEMTLLQQTLEANGTACEVYHGGLSKVQRSRVLKLFKGERPTPTVLIIQIMAGGIGLNLQEFSNVFILSPDWNPTNEFQAISRAHRFGQTETVKVHKYVLTYNPEFMDNPEEFETVSTIDQRILRAQITKRTMMATILNDPTLLFSEQITQSKMLHGDRISIVSEYDL